MGAYFCVVWVLSATSAAINHNNPPLPFSFDSVLRLAVEQESAIGHSDLFLHTKEHGHHLFVNSRTFILLSVLTIVFEFRGYFLPMIRFFRVFVVFQ
jgi:hypothetical protein